MAADSARRKRRHQPPQRPAVGRYRARRSSAQPRGAVPEGGASRNSKARKVLLQTTKRARVAAASRVGVGLLGSTGSPPARRRYPPGPVPEPETLHVALCTAVAFAAGWIDAMAGGGGILTMPAIASFGFPMPLVGGTNKVVGTCGSV